MKSFSKIIKASNLALIDEVKIISHPTPIIKEPVTVIEDEEKEITKDENTVDFEILRKAKEEAESIIENAEQKARALVEDAQLEVQKQWELFHSELEALKQEAEEQGFKDGYEVGKQQAEERIKLEYKEKIEQAKNLIDQAYVQKETIISEAEPFLLELSTVIATQILKQELTDYPDKFVQLIKQHILRMKEREYVSVCVHPEDYDFVQSQKSQLVAIVNGETEIKVVPDPLVSLHGCVIRTDYGSVDARIDTQIEEIKKVLLDARKRGRESGINS